MNAATLKTDVKKHKRLVRAAGSIALSRIGMKAPLRVMHFVTFRCNLTCSYCGIWKRPMREMCTADVKSAIKEFADAGTLQWVLTGGEPLLRKDIGKIVDYARDFGLIVNLTTNGTMLREKFHEVRNASYFVLSLDGPKNVNDRMRGAGSFDKAISGIKTAVDRGAKVVINSTLSKENIRNDFAGVRGLFNISEDLGTGLNFSVMYKDSFNAGSGELKRKLDSVFPSRRETAEALDFIKSYKQNHLIKGIFTNPVIERLKTMKPWKKCYSGKLFCDLFPDGTVVPCLFRHDEGIDGLEKGFVNAFRMLASTDGCFCSNTCYNELNSTFSLNPESLAENFWKYLTLS